jgi:hypothetical protein
MFPGQRLSLPRRSSAKRPKRPGRRPREEKPYGHRRWADPRRAHQRNAARQDRPAKPLLQTPRGAEAATLPAMAGVAAVPTARTVGPDRAPSALEQFIVRGDCLYAGRRPLGLGIMLVNLLIGAAMLAWGVVPLQRFALWLTRTASAMRNTYSEQLHKRSYIHGFCMGQYHRKPL